MTTSGQMVRTGMSDLTIRNLFVIPTIAFLIVMNVFPLLWSLFLSFHQWRANSADDPVFVGIANYRAILNDPNLWSTFALTAQYVVYAVIGELIVGFGIALLLNRQMRAKGLVTTLLLLPMMMSPAVVGLSCTSSRPASPTRSSNVTSIGQNRHQRHRLSRIASSVSAQRIPALGPSPGTRLSQACSRLDR